MLLPASRTSGIAWLGAISLQSSWPASSNLSLLYLLMAFSSYDKPPSLEADAPSFTEKVEGS